VFTYLPASLIENAGSAKGYFFFLIAAQITYLIALFSVVLIHRSEVERRNDG
jgi:hypothetical protein